jgi:DNA-binding MarR family transcriptional regulator
MIIMADDVLQTNCVCMHARRAGRQLAHFYDQFLRPAGIRSSQYGMLRCIDTLLTPFISDIARVLSMDQTTVTRNVKQLEKISLVKTLPHPDDPRKKMVVLTKAGRQKLIKALPLWEKAQERIHARVSDEKIETLFSLLAEVSNAAKNL